MIRSGTNSPLLTILFNDSPKTEFDSISWDIISIDITCLYPNF